MSDYLKPWLTQLPDDMPQCIQPSLLQFNSTNDMAPSTSLVLPSRLPLTVSPRDMMKGMPQDLFYSRIDPSSSLWADDGPQFVSPNPSDLDNRYFDHPEVVEDDDDEDDDEYDDLYDDMYDHAPPLMADLDRNLGASAFLEPTYTMDPVMDPVMEPVMEPVMDTVLDPVLPDLPALDTSLLEPSHEEGSVDLTPSDVSPSDISTPPTDTSPEPSYEPAKADRKLKRKSAAPTGAGPHRCQHVENGVACGKVFSRPYDLIRHQDTIHANVRKSYSCELCGAKSRTFSRLDALSRHIRVKHK